MAAIGSPPKNPATWTYSMRPQEKDKTRRFLAWEITKDGKELGRGSCDVFHRAVNVYTGEEVAYGESVGKGTKSRRALLKEKEILRIAKRGPYCIFTHAFVIGKKKGISRAVPRYVIQELCLGANLEETLATSSDPAEKKRWLMQLKSAIAYLHQNQIVHRDIKPANCLLTPERDLKLSDFGSAVKVGEECGKTHGTTQGFRSPELLDFEVDQWILAHPSQDVWSFAITCSKVMGENLPGHPEETLIENYRIALASDAPLSYCDDAVSSELREVLEGALRYDPQKRSPIEECADFP